MRRERFALAAVFAVSGALVLFACGRVWVEATISEPGFPVIVVTVTGRTIAPLTAATGLLALAAAAVTFLVRRWGAAMVGAIVALVALAGGWAAISAARDPQSAASTSIVEALGRTGAEPATLTTSGWAYVAALSCALMSVAGLLLALRAPRWRVTGRRFDQSPAASPIRAQGIDGADEGHGVLEADDLWKALDRGEDPTT